MPGNEIGDRVHNFFEQEHLSRGQNQSQIADVNWVGVNNNRWNGSQRQYDDTLSFRTKDYIPQQSDPEAHTIQSRQAQYGFCSPPLVRPALANNRSYNQHPDLDGNIYGHQVSQRRPEEANFLGVGAESYRNNSNGRGFSMYGPAQGSGAEHPATSGRLDTFESPVSYDFFGGQPKVNDRPVLLQSLPPPQSGVGDMHQLQQHLMFRKMQELQRQEDIQHLHARQQYSVKQVTAFTKKEAGKNSHDFTNGTPVSDAYHPWTTEMPAGNRNRLHHASTAMQGSSGGLTSSPGQVQALNSVNLVRQQLDQSLPGVPVSGSRDNLNQDQFARDKPLQQMTTYNNSFLSNQHAAFPQQVTMKDDRVNSRQVFQGKDMFGYTSHQGQSSQMNLENHNQPSPQGKIEATQEFQEKRKVIGMSEVSHDKIVEQAPHSQNSIALDPAEEKILFGSDDGSIWDAFGKTDDGVSNLLDGTDFMNGLPSIQSGSWSALMQSAVAETSSSDVGHQEDCTNLSIENPDFSASNHQSLSYEAEKHQTALVNNNLSISSAFTFGSVAPSDDTNSNHIHAQGVLQFGHKISQEHVAGLQSNSSHRPTQQSLAGGSNWLSSKNQRYGTASHTVDAEINGRRYSNHGALSQNGVSQPFKPYNLSVTNGVTPNGQKIQENENFVHNYQMTGQKPVVHEAMIHKNGMRKVDSISNSSAELEQLRSTTGSSLANAAGEVLKSTKLSVSEEASLFGGCKPMEASLRTQESENSRKVEHLRKVPQLVKSAFHSSEEEVNMKAINTVSKKTNDNASYRPNMFHHNFTAGRGEKDLVDASGPQSLAGGKQKSSKQADQKFAGPRKFQFHPMGNLDEDVEPSYQMRGANNYKMMPLHNSQGFRSQDAGFFRQSNLLGQFPNSCSEKEKGQLSDHHGDASRNEASLKGNRAGYVPSMSSANNKPVGMSTSYSSENMLELLCKADIKERSTERHLTPTGHSSLSQTPEAESSNGTVGCLQDNQSSAIQGYGLQLAPPSQRPGLNHVPSSPSQTVKYISSTQDSVVTRGMGLRMLEPADLDQSMPSPHEVSQREFKNKRTVIPAHTAREESPPKMQENVSSDSGFSYPRSQLQDQLISKASGQVSINSHTIHGYQFAGHSVLDAAGSAPYDKSTSSLNISRSTPTNYPHDRVSADKNSAGDLLSVSKSITTGTSSDGAPTNMLYSVQPNVSPQQRYVGTHACHSQPKPNLSSQSDIVESTFSVPHNLVDQGPTLMDEFPSEFCTGFLHPQGLVFEKEHLGKDNSCLQLSSGSKDLIQKLKESPSQEPNIQQLHRAPPVNPPSTQRDIEAFGRTLKPNNFIQQNFSLVNQIRAMKSVETDPSNRGSKRLKGPNNRLMSEQVVLRTGQPYEDDAMVKDPPFSTSSVSEPDDNGGTNVSSYKIEKLPSQDVLKDQIESENFRHGGSTGSIRTEHLNISPQMAPSWFNQYGSFKNGQMLQVYDASKAVTLKTVEHPPRQSFNNMHTDSQVHTNAVADTNEISAKLLSTDLMSLQSLPRDELCGNLVISRPKKRKCASSELQSWQKEVSQSCPDLQCLRVAEENWSKAAKRPSEKVEDNVDTIEAGSPMPRARRRLSLTRQLMQLLFSAPPEVILSAEARSNYETVTYVLARRTLGDTCSFMSCSDGENLQADKRKSSDKSHEQRTSQVMEDFMGRVRKLETELSRLDKRSSVSDLRIEVQDVEKISIINRFAMFHSRLQSDGADTQSLRGASANSEKPFPQRFVTAVPLPRNLPDSVQCLSL
ncbi:hypothetical protein DCAR_0416918 [Daucus carota subsp. sativus]|uniref:Uncharacterized protein n=1 Tax=Daucus carota subsp. sativus TaxID=79200 RepID=A0A165XWJ9_DAUCS|nr:PREDICTED: uncharacterized protein LOC108218604 [Daucus carota subsp. sativus]WOG97577.1 hypothetical protein DCAR_0416918 [Daucus carota subsp. sativus]